MDDFFSKNLPWIFLGIVFVLGNASPLWRWWRKRVAADWPVAPGEIVSASIVEPAKFLGLTINPAKSRMFKARLTFNYVVAGQTYSGIYDREFGREDEATDFLRYLPGATIEVHYDPRKPQAAQLSEASLERAMQLRPPRQRTPAPDIPNWLKPLLWPFVLLAATGLLLSLWVHAGAIVGRKVAPEPFFWAFTLASSLCFSQQFLLPKNGSDSPAGAISGRSF
jgi:Protein of unknown function (DUF3592)